jgi:enamine deaminase RidA (YjgF/YER057c/UK114 family)
MLQRIKKRKTLHAVTIHNGVVYLAGIRANDIGLDMEGQTRQICEKVDGLLEQAGSDKTKLIRAEIFITDMEKPDMNRAWVAWLREQDLPCRATIGVADLGEPERLIEVIITAIQ